MKKGFTIIELLVVISVLVILIAISIPRFKGMQDSGKVAKVKKELSTMQAALESYRMNQETPAYPPTIATLGASYLATTSPQLIASALYDPLASSSTTEYNYVLSSNGAYYVVYSVGLGNITSAVTISDVGAVGRDAGQPCASNGSGC